MRATFSLGLFFAFGLSAFLGACGDDTGGPADGATCSTNADCAAGSECSAGSCIAVVACSSDSDCSGGQKCESGACRTACQTNADCAALGLICDAASSLCLPDTNPSAGSGGTTNGTGGSSNGTGGSGPTTATADIIDDLEDGDVQILDKGSRIGFWYSYNEDSPRPRIPLSAVVDDGGSKVLHATGSHKSGVASDAAYGGLGVDLNNPDPSQQGPLSASREPYDASAWDGLQFRIKSSVTKSIRFEIVTTAVATPAEGGDCSSGTCFDSFGMDVVLSDSWTTVKVPYAALVQEGWGDAKSFDPSTILGVAFEDLTTNDWDFYVDDLAFYQESDTGTPTDPGDPGPGGGDPTCSGSWGDEPNGSITWYTFSQGTAAIGDVNCSYGISQNPDKVNHVATGDGQYFGAINTTDYATAAACGACVEVSRGSKKVVVTIVDQCPVSSNPKCVKGHIDLSKAAFLQLGNESEGYIGKRAGNDSITWKYVPCATTAKVSARLKEPSNSYWNMVLVEDHVYPIQSVQVKVGSDWLNASRSEYNYWLPPGGRMGTAPYSLRITDVNGSILETTVALAAGDQSTGKQFSCE